VNLRKTIPALAVVLFGANGCAFITGLVSAGGADNSAFTVDMEGYDVKKIDLVRPEARGGICPGTAVAFKVSAEVIDKKKSQKTMLESADPKGKANDARGKMDLTEFAMAARGGSIDSGVFTASPDPFAALLGYDVKATFRLDKSKTSQKHFAPEYTCITGVGTSGASGNYGGSGNGGSSNGGAGGAGGQGGAGSAGPKLNVYVSIVETPLFDRVGVIRVSGDVEQLTLFDLSTGMNVSARGGSGGDGGSGGNGGQGAGPFGSGKSGGPGGAGGDGGPGGDGGSVVVVTDDRFPELRDAIRVDVSGGGPGGAGSGGRGGSGTPPDKGLPEGPKGPDGPPGSASNVAGRDGSIESRAEDVGSMFAELPPGVRLSGAPRAEPAPPPPPPEPPTKGKKKKPA
jgi:hypothetical protein